MSKTNRILIVIIIAVIAVVGAINIKKIQDKKSLEANKVDRERDLGIPIELVDVGKGDLVDTMSYIGTIKSKKSTVVSPAIGGQIKKINVEEGDLVGAGDILAEIEDNQFAASYNTAASKLNTLQNNYNYLKKEVANFHQTSPLAKRIESATSNYEYMKAESEKMEELYNEGAIAETEYDKIKQERDTAYFQLQELKASLDDAYRKLIHERDMAESQISEVNASMSELDIKIKDTLIRAPIAGVVKTVHYDLGDLAAMGMPFFNIDNNQELIVEVNISESDLNKINVEDKVALRVKGLDDEIASTVSKIIPNVNPKTRVGLVEIGPIKAQEGLDLVSGNSAEIDIVIDQVEDKVIIPKSTIKNLGDESVVYIYSDGLVKERKITTGMTVGEKTEVVEGLEEGEQIAIKNLSKLYEDAKVYIFKGAEKR